MAESLLAEVCCFTANKSGEH